mmetsp:Transcript_9240/g.24706  ORF Transcript_9240/g.24706 Transcript_9240/m.24706 type:complete len:223 (+) Transcript_9240:2-670(+)
MTNGPVDMSTSKTRKLGSASPPAEARARSRARRTVPTRCARSRTASPFTALTMGAPTQPLSYPAFTLSAKICEIITASLRSGVRWPRRNSSCRCAGRSWALHPCRYSWLRFWKTSPPHTKKRGRTSNWPLGTRWSAGWSVCCRTTSLPSRQTDTGTRAPTGHRSRAAAKCSRRPSSWQKPCSSRRWPLNSSSTSPLCSEGCPVASASCILLTRTPARSPSRR